MDKSSNNQTFFQDLEEAAQELRRSKRSILRDVKNGKIRGKKVKGRWLFSRKAILAYGLGFGPRLSAAERKEFQELTSGN